MSKCYLCPRACGVDRALGEKGFCKEGDDIRVSHYSLHLWEEPSISGERGSGTIFFGGCSLKCEFCQNMSISQNQQIGHTVSIEHLCDIMLELYDMGAENINLVTPTHFASKIASAISLVKDRLPIPVVYNSSGYENVDTLKMFEGLVDIYLPDFKYFSDDIAKKYSSVSNYREHAKKAITEMYRQVGSCKFDQRGIMLRGLIIRHLVLPTCRHDSISVVNTISELLPNKDFYISIMSQYTPDFAKKAKSAHKELHRKLTTFEYTSVVERVRDLGLIGYCQDRSSSTTSFTPDFK